MGRYSDAIFAYRRRPTREVMVGDVGIGGDNPIRVQSMTIADTKHTEAVVAETKGLVEAGCEIVRITAPTIHHAENLKNIKEALRKEGIQVPLVADIHFTPQAAMIAADHVEKVRINPGNYADRKLFAVKEYTDEQYQTELDHMAEKFLPLVKKCKQNGVAMRIGTNHGSLSDRIMNRFGDTPEGMVESALEFVRLCESEGYYEIILSMKASSPFIMISAYRLLAERMNDLGMDYPFHLGVTEAGEGEDGRIKSAVGIGSLLEDGIGDTVRVSLTEDSIYEIPVARQLVKKFNRANASEPLDREYQPAELTWHPVERARRPSAVVQATGLEIGGDRPIAVATVVKAGTSLPEASEGEEVEKRGDLVFLTGLQDETSARKSFEKIKQVCPELRVGAVTTQIALAEKLLNTFDAVRLDVADSEDANVLDALADTGISQQKLIVLQFSSADSALNWAKGRQGDSPVLLTLATDDPIHEYRRLALGLDLAKISLPIHVQIHAGHFSEATLEGASALGSLLMDGIGDSVGVTHLDWKESVALSFNILQATRLRISKAEFIACPSCGRTLFDLQETTQRIKQKTGHLKGVKIAIMGCIVNGPGEMADADFGYVGGGPGKIHLYVGKECVEKNIPTAIADEKLIDLIKQHDRWVEPPEVKGEGDKVKREA